MGADQSCCQQRPNRVGVTGEIKIQGDGLDDSLRYLNRILLGNPVQYVLSATSAPVYLRSLSKASKQLEYAGPTHISNDQGLVYIMNVLGNVAYPHEVIVVLSVYAGPFMADGPIQQYGSILRVKHGADGRASKETTLWRHECVKMVSDTSGGEMKEQFEGKSSLFMWSRADKDTTKTQVHNQIQYRADLELVQFSGDYVYDPYENANPNHCKGLHLSLDKYDSERVVKVEGLIQSDSWSSKFGSWSNAIHLAYDDPIKGDADRDMCVASTDPTMKQDILDIDQDEYVEADEKDETGDISGVIGDRKAAVSTTITATARASTRSSITIKDNDDDNPDLGPVDIDIDVDQEEEDIGTIAGRNQVSDDQDDSDDDIDEDDDALSETDLILSSVKVPNVE